MTTVLSVSYKNAFVLHDNLNVQCDSTYPKPYIYEHAQCGSRQPITKGLAQYSWPPTCVRLFWRNQNVVSVLKAANLNKLVHKGQHLWSFPTVWIPWWKHSVRGKVDASTGVCFAIILFMKVVSKMTCWRRSELTTSCYLLFVPKSPKTRPVDERVPTVW